MNNGARKSALRNFLMEMRARLGPGDVGLASIGRRRVPGLRREEVAELAKISPAWYTLLETGRDIRVSSRMLDRLATALRLSDSEKLHLFSLAIEELPTMPHATPEQVGAIGRIWKGQTRASDAAAYRAYVRDTGLADYQRTSGNRGAFVFTSVNGDVAEVITMSLWDSLDAIKAFAGDDVTLVRFYPEDERYLIAADRRAAHYEVDA